MTLAGREYQIGQARKLCQDILQLRPLWEWLVGEDFEIIRDLFSYHPTRNDYDQKIEAIRVGLNRHPTRVHRAFHVRLWTKEIEQPSYTKCFLPGDLSHKTKVTKALRRAIDDQVRKVRDAAGSKEKGHVHHDGVPFVGLRDEWVFLQNGYESIPVDNGGDMPGYFLTDETQLQSWRDFHAKNATLVFMTIDEHKEHHRKQGRTNEE